MTKTLGTFVESPGHKDIHFFDSSYCFLTSPKSEIIGTSFEADGKGADNMEGLSPADIERNMRQFSLLAVRVLRNAAITGHNEYRNRAKREVTISELSDSELNQFYSVDNYQLDGSVFYVVGLEIIVQDNRIVDALNQLQERHRNVILLKYYAKWTDKQIADLYNVQRQTIQYQRNSILKTLKNMIHGGQSNGE